MRRITKPLSLLLALVMAIGLLPVTALAAESETASVTVGTTGGWGAFAETSALSLPFGQSGNKVKVWTDSVGINISAIAVNGDTRPLTDAAVEMQGADFNGSAVENLHNAGSYAVIDLDALGFGDLSGTQSVTLTYATENDGFELHAVSSFDEVQQLAETSTPTAEPTTESATEAGEAPAEADQEVAEYAATSYGKVTVTGIAATGDWDAINSAHQNWFEIKDVRLDPNGNIKIYGENAGINIAAVEINGQKVTVTEMKNSGTVAVSGKDSQGADVSLEQKGSEYQIAYLDINGVSATIQLSAFSGLTAGVHNIKFYYAIQTNPATLIVESSAGEGETAAAYDSISHGDLGGTVTPPSGEGHTTDARKSITENDQTNPQKAVWFFDSHGEVKSFNSKNDTYEDVLETGLHNNDLILYTSTDGTVRSNGNGELWINWENQYRASAPDVNGNVMDGGGYTDGSYTIVGWGGDFHGDSDLAKNAIRFRVKDGGDGTLSDALSHLTIYLVNSDGEVEDKVWVKSATGDDTSVDSLHYVSTTADGYHIFEATLHGSHLVQGIKLAFDRYSQSGSHQEDSVTHHSGTLIIANVEIQVNDEWEDFGPFNYYDDDSNYEHPYKSPVISGSRPFVRSAHYKSLMQQGLHEGCNLANPQTGFEWHLWTMSTSDANIVNNTYSNADALQIKYSNTAAHRTYTHLVGNKELNGEWLVVTLGGEVDANTRFQLVNSSAPSTTDQKDFSATLSLSDFRESKDDNGTVVTADLFSDNHYHTIYYHMQGETFKSVYVDFTNVSDEPGDASRYMYITEIYLLEPAAKIGKTVDKKEAATGDELVYTLTVTNNDDQPITKFTVTDTLPEGVTFVSSSPAVSLGADGQTITWDYNDGAFQPDESRTLTVTVQVNTGFQGTLVNSGTITSLNDKEKTIGSNHVTTVVTAKTPEEFVFYAEVGQKTTLPIALGSTANSTTSTDTVEKTQSSVWLRYASGYGDGDYVTASGTVKLDSDGSIKITTNANGGISIRRIRLNDTTVLWMDNKQTKTAGNVTVTGAVYFGSTDGGFAEGEIKNLKDGSIVISGLAAGDYTVEFLYRSWNSPAMDLTSITQETTTEPGEPVQDIIAGVPASSANNAVVEANGIVGENSGSLLYTSKVEGKDTFELTYNPGGDANQTKTAKVTVYNYKVDNKIYVLDYGLSVNLTGGSSGLLTDATLKLENDNTGYAFAGLRSRAEGKRNTDTVADEADYATPYGNTLVTGQNGVAEWITSPSDQSLGVTFTPTTFMSSIDTFYYGVQVSKENTVASDATNATPVMEGEIKIMPANVVYYEDNFSQSDTENANGVNGIIYTGATTVSSNAKTFEWQSNKQDIPYGYDDEAYEEAIEQWSNGSAHELKAAATASFTFKGTGFDIIGRTNDSSGMLRALIYAVDDAGNATFKKFILVDTYYENGDLYQIPVISILGLDYGKYKVVLSYMKGYADEYGGVDGSSVVYIDGVRIYNPLGVNGNEDYNEGEQGAKFMELKSMIFGENFVYDRDNPEKSYWRGGSPKNNMATLVKYSPVDDKYLNGATLVEVLKNRNDDSETAEKAPSSTYDLLTYAFSGPNKELYLEDNYGFGFEPTLINVDAAATLQVGIKLISKSAKATAYPFIEYLDGDGEWQYLCEVRSSTEKYYSLDTLMADPDALYYGQVVLRVDDNNSGAIVSVTNIKYKNYEFQILTTEKENKPILEIKPGAISVKSGYDRGTGMFKTGSITMTVETKKDIREVFVYTDEGGENKVTLLSMTYKDSGDSDDATRKWTIKFKGTDRLPNYWLQIVDEYGNVSKLAAAVG